MENLKMAESEFILLRRFSTSGDAEAFAQIIKRHAPMVYGVCLRILANREIAADVVQDTFFQLVRDAAEITESLPNWLHKVATHRSIDLVRSDSQRKQRELIYAANPGKVDSEDNKAIWHEISACIDEELENLDDQTREVLILRFFENLAMTEIAEKCNISQPTVSRRIDSGIELLRQKLKSRGIIVSAAVFMTLLSENVIKAAPASIMKELGKIALAGNKITIGTKIASSISAGITVKTKLLMIIVGCLAVGSLCIVSLLFDIQVNASSDEMLQEIITNIKNNDNLIHDIENKTVVYQFIEGEKQVFWDVNWGYDRGKEYFDGHFSINLGDEGVGGYKGRKLAYHKTTFDGSKQFNLVDLAYIEKNPPSNKVSGGITAYRPKDFKMRQTLFLLMGRATQDSQDTLATMLEKADSVVVKDEMEIINGHKCYIVEAIGIESNKRKYNHRFWLDPERGFLPLKRQKFSQHEYQGPWDALKQEIVDIKLEKIDGVWLPVEGKVLYYDFVETLPDGMSEEEFINKYKGEPESVIAKAVNHKTVPSESLTTKLVMISDVKINQGIPADKFRIIFPTGCIVWDEFLQLGYTVGEI